jgi:hypothetical protein
MQDVTVRKADLIEKITANREAHRAIFLEAVDGYRGLAEEMLQKHLAEVRSGQMKVVRVVLDAPVDHTRDYDRVLAMLGMSVDDQITLAQSDFAQYVLDDWSWKRQFLTSNSTYSGTAATQLREM